MLWLQNLPVKRKLTLVILVTCSAVLLLACGVLAVYELFDFRKTMARDMTVLADILAKNTRAVLVFQDESEARLKLSTFQEEPHVMVACLYASDGSRFVE